MQLTSDLLGRKIARPDHFDMSCLGAAFVTGLGTGKKLVHSIVGMHGGVTVIALFFVH